MKIAFFIATKSYFQIFKFLSLMQSGLKQTT